MSAQLVTTLRQLDPGNDNHWTADGSPRLETVKFMAGESFTREQVTQTVPGFSRATAAAYWAAADQGSTQAPQQPATTPPATLEQPTAYIAQGVRGLVSTADDAQGDGYAESVVPGGVAGDSAQGKSSLEELQAHLQQGQEYLVNLRRERDQLGVEIAKTEKALDRVIEAVETARQGSALGGNVFREYLNAQQKVSQERGARIEAMKGLNLRDILPSRAKIDEAFARRNQRGTQRPVVPSRK